MPHPRPIRTGFVPFAAAAAAPMLIASLAATASTVDRNGTLTAVGGVKVGHHTLAERPTGCTVVLTEAGAVAGVDVRGAAPGTRETDLLDPVNTVEQVHAIVLAGGSAFGLDAASGTVRWLDEHGIGFQTSGGKVPIVPAAILYDLRVGDGRVRPGADCGYRAAQAASAAPVAEGSVGAGAGATVGKLRMMERAMKGGIGSSAIATSDGLVVAALVAVNAVGDVIDPATGAVVAGVRTEDGKALADARRLLRERRPSDGRSGARGGYRETVSSGENTTLAVVATNARLTKSQATKLAQMAHDGLARAIWPVHTPTDGDTVFAIATGARETADGLLVIGALGADAVAEAVVRAVRQATSVSGIPAERDLAR